MLQFDPALRLLRSVVWAIPWSQGKTQGISPNPPPFREIRLENICDSSGLRGNSLRGGAGNFFVHAGNYFRLFDRGSENGLKSIRSPRPSIYCALSRRGTDGAGPEVRGILHAGGHSAPFLDPEVRAGPGFPLARE